jgi:cytochrome c oxidase subunit 3
MSGHMDQKTKYEGSKLGMWLFLFTEIILFGGLFVLYAAYFSSYTADFITAGKKLDTVLGAVNTIILLTSSFTVAASITAIRSGSKKAAIWLLSISIAFALAFLVNKYFEWGHKFEVGLFPNSEKLAALPQGEQIFYALYYTVTGLHGLHVVIGMLLLGICLIFVAKDRIQKERFGLLENSGLYWHLVDLIWIFVFPLFYLVT